MNWYIGITPNPTYVLNSCLLIMRHKKCFILHVANLKDLDSRADHYSDVIMGAMASQITSLTIVYSTVYSDADERKHQSSASLVFVRGIQRSPVNSPHKGSVTRKMFPFNDVIMQCRNNFLSVIIIIFPESGVEIQQSGAVVTHLGKKIIV